MQLLPTSAFLIRHVYSVELPTNELLYHVCHCCRRLSSEFGQIARCSMYDACTCTLIVQILQNKDTEEGHGAASMDQFVPSQGCADIPEANSGHVSAVNMKLEDSSTSPETISAQSRAKAVSRGGAARGRAAPLLLAGRGRGRGRHRVRLD